MCERKLKEAFEKENIMVLKSDNIKIGDRIPLPNSKIGIVTKEVKTIGKRV